ncbi:hypothetical protein H6F76_09865 [Leptolyngbya sp. FACHB-321]|uniref:hypothetical protein n=1 Tax=Leptolyngbya sp. FACHB-321 TaxID=2692807 RepID=UPI00168346D0|nr:hypothetical protein [Leptolyngbya sp. FACHB-321]MBD2035328.1 hypothetical protein [Leptolyngbya sp. FACHB-321]
MADSTQILGLLNFPFALCCSPDVLGQSFPIRMGDYHGTLEMPSLPSWGEKEKDPLHKGLKAPAAASTWKRGDDPIVWGHPLSYPEGVSSVERALISFDITVDDVETSVQKIYQSNWIQLFSDYYEILEERGQKNMYVSGSIGSRLELFHPDSSSLGYIRPHRKVEVVITALPSANNLKLDVFRQICKLASDGLPPNLQYRLLIDSYRALAREDYRKAILEAASALEVSLTKRIILELNNSETKFGENPLKQYSYRTLGGRFKLAALLPIALPEKERISFIIEARNSVIHEATFPGLVAAQKFVSETALLLSHLTPNLSQD